MAADFERRFPGRYRTVALSCPRCGRPVQLRAQVSAGRTLVGYIIWEQHSACNLTDAEQTQLTRRAERGEGARVYPD